MAKNSIFKERSAKIYPVVDSNSWEQSEDDPITIKGLIQVSPKSENVEVVDALQADIKIFYHTKKVSSRANNIKAGDKIVYDGLEYSVLDALHREDVTGMINRVIYGSKKW